MIDWSDFDTDAVTIVSQPRGTDGLTFTEDVVYTGNADFQPRSGETFTDPSGQLQIIDAVLMIDPDVNGNLPSIEIVDGGSVYVARVNGVSYNVVFAANWAMYPPHLHLILKRGPQKYSAK